ncbi:MAG: electron transfer flavoprotein subunit alpha/FixB family protein [Oscillospiraceae bacterium]|nr:electron transfer flavoprotein subunit alpha/FixB family protein [Oscillospiraceae bacterium]
MLKNVLVFSLSGTELISRANAVAENTVLVTAAGALTGADTVYTYPAESSVALQLKAIADVAAELQPELVLCEATASGRLVAGYLAALLKTNSLPDVQTLEITDAGLESTRMVYGGSFVKAESVPYPAVAIVGGGVLLGDENLKAGETKELSGTVEGLELVSVSESGVSMGNLAGAKRVVCVGRGLGSADNLPLVDELAGLLDAEIGCTRPAAEEENWYPKNRYIGISGVMLKSKMYLGLGVSGQMQHMIGTRSCGSIFAVNKLEGAAIVDEADYTLVGNVNTALPAIIEKLK